VGTLVRVRKNFAYKTENFALCQQPQVTITAILNEQVKLLFLVVGEKMPPPPQTDTRSEARVLLLVPQQSDNFTSPTANTGGHGVATPKDAVVIVFVLLLWLYSISLMFR